MKLRALSFFILVSSFTITSGHASFDVEAELAKQVAKEIKVAVENQVIDWITPDSITVRDLKISIKDLKKQKKAIKDIRKNISDQIKGLRNSQNYANLMESLLNCLEGPNSLSFNAVADESMRELKVLKADLATLSGESLSEDCRTKEFEMAFRKINKTVALDEEYPELILVNLTSNVIYSSQDLLDLFQYYVAHLNRVIEKHESFARTVGHLQTVVTDRLQDIELKIDVPQEILDGLERQKKLALYKTKVLAQEVLNRGGGDGREPFYTFRQVKTPNIRLQHMAGTDITQKFLDPDEPFFFEAYPLPLELIDIGYYSRTVRAKEAELSGYAAPEVNIENPMEGVEEIIPDLDEVAFQVDPKLSDSLFFEVDKSFDEINYLILAALKAAEAKKKSLIEEDRSKRKK